MILVEALVTLLVFFLLTIVLAKVLFAVALTFIDLVCVLRYPFELVYRMIMRGADENDPPVLRTILALLVIKLLIAVTFGGAAYLLGASHKLTGIVAALFFFLA